MTIRKLVVMACALVNLAGAVRPASAQRADPPAPRVAVIDDGSGAALDLLDAIPPVPIAVRIQVADPTRPGLDAQLAALERRRVPLWLAVSAPATATEIDAWRRGLNALLNRRDSTLETLEVVIDRQPASVAVFAMQVAATDARARRNDVTTAIGGDAIADAERRGEIYTDTLAPYVDMGVATDKSVAALVTWLRQVDASATVAVISEPQADATTDPIRWVLDPLLLEVGTSVMRRAWRPTELAVAMQGLRRITPLLSGNVVTLNTVAARPSLSVGGRDISGIVRHRLLFDTSTFGTYLVYWGDASIGPLRVGLTLPIEGTPRIHELVSGVSSPGVDYVRDAATARVELTVPVTGGPMLVDFNEGAAAVLVEPGAVTAARQLTVAEIIARHQQAQAAQDMLVHSYIASARMRQHFRPTMTDPGYDIVTENRYFVEGPAVEWEELSFSVNGSKWEGDRPPFPLLQPEKVLSLPLQLRFDEGYRYELVGTERVNGFDCYIVRFEPVRLDGSLYRGRVWIDRRTFARIQVQAVQSGLSAPVVSNEETLRYVHATTIDNRPIFLFGGLTARQIVLVAGRNLLIEKDVSFAGFRVNDVEFAPTRAAARASDRIMYRETERGLRYFVKRGEERVISDNLTSSVRALAMGVYVDPSYAFPLPIFGVNYLNFGLGQSDDAQLALLFAGVLVAGNVQRPRLGSTPFDASVDFFAIAAPTTDRLYRPGGEAESERVLTWPMSTGLNLGWQATPYQKATFQYQLRFDAYVRDRTTADTFTPPSSTLTNGLGGAWEYRRGGYNLTLSGSWFMRSRWNAWGPQSAIEQPDASRTYVKYAAGISRTILVGPFQAVYLNANWFGGRDLDRFVQYQFGMFDDTRIHGVPAGGVRFSELAMVRGSYSLNIFEQYRLDVFLEHGWGRDPRAADEFERIPGVGAAVNFRAFWNTILRAEVGHSVLPARYDGLGSTTLQVLLLKPLK